MCTISWFYHQEGYELFFNRDESKTRPPATLPQILEEPYEQAPNRKAIMPIDPQGNGSWLAVNDLGVSFALLNFYQGRLPKGALRSRGRIVKELALQASLPLAIDYLKSLDLERYAPFSLLLVAPRSLNNLNKCDGCQSVDLFRWTGKSLQIEKQSSPLFSSAVRLDEVSEVRLAVYNQKMENMRIGSGDPLTTSECIDTFKRLHTSHLPGKSAESICMHRDDAQTVSFSHISVGKEHALYNYHDGPACDLKKTDITCLRLHS